MICDREKIYDDVFMEDVESKKKTVNVELSDRANKVVDLACEVHGMKKKLLVQRVLEWFAAQDKTTRAALVGQFTEEDVPAIARLILERLAQGRTSGPGRTPAPLAELPDPSNSGVVLEIEPSRQASPKKKPSKRKDGPSAA